MLLQLTGLPYNRLTEGEAYLSLYAQNQQLMEVIAARRGNDSARIKHMNIAKHFQNAVNSRVLHSTSQNALSYIATGKEVSAVNKIIQKARKMNKPCISLTKKEEQVFYNNALNNLRSPIDEFDATQEQVNQCKSDAALMALKEELKSGRTFNPGTFDSNTQQVHPVGTNGRLVVINTANLRAREQKIFEACTSRVVMENIVNKKLSEAGNLAIYSIMHQQGHQITWNARVQARLYWQEQWVATTAKATGLSETNIRLVMENSAINSNEETPSETIVKTGAMLIAPDSKIPTSLPPLSDTEGSPIFAGGLPTIPDFSNPDDIRKTLDGLVTASLASGNLGLIILSISARLIFEIVNAIQKRRQDIYKSLDDPSIIAARCADANIPLEDCEGLATDSIGNGEGLNVGKLSNLVKGGAVLGLGMFLISIQKDKDEKAVVSS